MYFTGIVFQNKERVICDALVIIKKGIVIYLYPITKYCGIDNSICISSDLDIQQFVSVYTLLNHKKWFVQYVFYKSNV